MEIEALKQYVVVETYRFGATLDCQIDCTPDAAAAVVPTMIITPLLENAFKYGGRTTTGQLIVEVDCQIRGDRLFVTVFNTGSWIEPTSVREGGWVWQISGRDFRYWDWLMPNWNVVRLKQIR
jgi:LytS/YehU family sensor histidine kinase